MKKRMGVTLVLAILLTLAIIGLRPESTVYGKDKGLLPSKYRALPAVARSMADRAKTDLTRELSIASERVVVTAVEGTNFPDSSLGIIEPGKRYLEAATPGYMIRFSADGNSYAYRGSGDRLVLELWTESEKAEQALIRSAVQDVRNRLGVSLNQVVLLGIDPMVFPDGSLGAPEPNVPFAIAPTPGYEIGLDVNGVTYRYWAAGERVVYVGSILTSARMATVYLGRERGEDLESCVAVAPLQRSVPVSADESGVVALEQLFAGPTEAEVAAGYTSLFSEETRGMLRDIRVEGRTAYLDLADVRAVLPMSGSCDRQVFFAQVEATLKHVLPVEWVAYTVEGDPLAFCEWMDLGCTRSQTQVAGQ